LLTEKYDVFTVFVGDLRQLDICFFYDVETNTYIYLAVLAPNEYRCF